MDPEVLVYIWFQVGLVDQGAPGALGACFWTTLICTPHLGGLLDLRVRFWTPHLGGLLNLAN